ncbi:MAG: DUF2007 domain-containing protein [Bacteroidia bacterium]|nr:DUF2007 domain-containing protein [Bacteroidia bacterium]
MKLVLVAAYTYPHEAHLAKGLLEAAGIECYLQDELTTQVNNFYSNAIGGVKLLVDEESMGLALQVLKEAKHVTKEDNLFDDDFETNEEVLICSNCGSNNVGSPRLKGAAALISILFLGFPFPFLIKKAHCFNCGRDFKP